MPALPSLNFQGMTEAASTKRMLSPAFASHMPTNATNAPGQVGISTQGAPLSVPSSPGILFGSFDQWEGARTGTASAGVADAPAVDAPEDVRYVMPAAFVLTAPEITGTGSRRTQLGGGGEGSVQWEGIFGRSHKLSRLRLRGWRQRGTGPAACTQALSFHMSINLVGKKLRACLRMRSLDAHTQVGDWDESAKTISLYDDA